MNVMMRVSNPLDVPQTLSLPGASIKVPAHGTAEIPARFRMAIWQRRCEEVVCRDEGLPWCPRGHKSGIVMGGLAPQLIDEGDIK